MEKLFKDFLKKRKDNEDFDKATGGTGADRLHKAEKEFFLEQVKKLDPTKYNLSSFLTDLDDRKDEEIFPTERKDFRRALIEKEKEKIKLISQTKDLQKESAVLKKMSDFSRLTSSEFVEFQNAITEQGVNITKGVVKAPAETVKTKLDKFVEKPKAKRKGCGCFSFFAIPAIVLSCLWIANGVLQKVFPDKKVQKGPAPIVKMAQPRPEQKVSVDTLIGFDEMKTSVSSELNKMKPAKRENMEKALRYIMLAQAHETATGKNKFTVAEEILKMSEGQEGAMWYSAAVRFNNEFERQGFSRIVANEQEAKSGEKVITYLETLDAAKAFYAQAQAKKLQNNNQR